MKRSWIGYKKNTWPYLKKDAESDKTSTWNFGATLEEIGAKLEIPEIFSGIFLYPIQDLFHVWFIAQSGIFFDILPLLEN